MLFSLSQFHYTFFAPFIVYWYCERGWDAGRVFFFKVEKSIFHMWSFSFFSSKFFENFTFFCRRAFAVHAGDFKGLFLKVFPVWWVLWKLLESSSILCSCFTYLFRVSKEIPSRIILLNCFEFFQGFFESFLENVYRKRHTK